LTLVFAGGGWFFYHRSAGSSQFASISQRRQVFVQKVTPSEINLDPGAHRDYTFAVPVECRTPRLRGNVQAVPPTAASKIEILLFDKTNFVAWTSRRPTSVLYRSFVNRGNIDISLSSEARQYDLIFHSAQPTQRAVVRVNIDLTCVR